VADGDFLYAPFDGLGHASDIFLLKISVHGQTDHPLGSGLGAWEIPGPAAKISECPLQMKSLGIMYGGGNPKVVHFLLKYLAFVNLDGVLGIDAGIGRRNLRDFY
jgi:hypothetical protein